MSVRTPGGYDSEAWKAAREREHQRQREDFERFIRRYRDFIVAKTKCNEEEALRLLEEQKKASAGR